MHQRRGKKKGKTSSSKKKKRNKLQGAKPPTPALVNNALIGNEEQNGTQKIEKRNKKGAGP